MHCSDVAVDRVIVRVNRPLFLGRERFSRGCDKGCGGYCIYWWMGLCVFSKTLAFKKAEKLAKFVEQVLPIQILIGSDTDELR